MSARVGRTFIISSDLERGFAMSTLFVYFPDGKTKGFTGVESILKVPSTLNQRVTRTPERKYRLHCRSCSSKTNQWSRLRVGRNSTWMVARRYASLLNDLLERQTCGNLSAQPLAFSSSALL